MSHFTEIKTELTELGLIQKTLKTLGLDFEILPGKAKVRGFYGDILKADIRIATGTAYDIGLRKDPEGSYEFVADWEMLKHSKFDSEAFRQKILQKYSYTKVVETLEEQGFEIGSEEVDETGNLQMTVQQW